MSPNFRMAAAGLIALLFQACAAAPHPSTAARAGLPNFGEVDSHLFRGARPEKSGLAELKKLGVKTIIDLLPARERSPWERGEAEALGIRYYNLPLAPYGRPTDHQIGEALALIDDPKNQPVFVHCAYGKDRTGTVVACHRMQRAGWSALRAQQEADRYHMSRLEYGMRSFIRDYPRSLARRTQARSGV